MSLLPQVCIRAMRIGRVGLLTASSLLLSSVELRHASAQLNTNFNVAVSRDASCLPSSGVPCSSGNLPGPQAMFAETKPFFELKNTNPNSTDGAITEFRMTIGDELFHFATHLHTSEAGGFTKYIKSSQAGLTFTSSVENNGNELVLKFGGSGLAPGEHVRFMAWLRPDNPSLVAAPSFTTILFDQGAFPQYANGTTNNSSDDNAKFRAKFSQATAAAALASLSTTSTDGWSNTVALADTATRNQFINGNYAPSGLSASLNPTLTFQVAGTSTNVSNPSGDIGSGGNNNSNNPIGNNPGGSSGVILINDPNPTGPIVPEPSSAILLLLAIVMLALATARRHRPLAYAPLAPRGTGCR